MTSTSKKTVSVQRCRELSTNLNQSIVGLLTAVGTRNTPGFQGALQSKVNCVKTLLESLRGAINSLPNIDTDLETQTERIAALQEQLRLKNEFIMKIREQQIDQMLPFVSVSDSNSGPQDSNNFNSSGDVEMAEVDVNDDGARDNRRTGVKDGVKYSPTSITTKN